MLNPVDPEVFARIKADCRARRGPFRHTVVMTHELVSHYDIRNIKRTQASWAMRQIGLREVIVTRDRVRMRLFVVDPQVDPTPANTREHFRRERGLPTTPKPPRLAPVAALPEELTTGGAEAVEALWPAMADVTSFSELAQRLYDRGAMSLPGSERRAIALALADRLGLKVTPASLSIMLTPSFTQRRMSGLKGR